MLRAFDPLQMEPVLRVLGIAVEPEPRAVYRAPRKRLLNERTRHKRDLVEQHSRKSHALNKRSRRLVLSAEKIESVHPAAVGNEQQILTELFLADKPEGMEQRDNRRDHVAPQRTDGFAAESEIAVAAEVKAPEHKRERHTKSLAASHRAVADNCVAAEVARIAVPPAEHPALLWRECFNHRRHFSRLRFRSRRTGCLSFRAPCSVPRASRAPWRGRKT